LCTRRDRPRGCHAANRDNEFSPSDADCHSVALVGALAIHVTASCIPNHDHEVDVTAQ
jgi:hypothetical protein